MPGYFQTAFYDGQYFTDSLRNDVILRSSSNTNVLIGIGCNVESKIQITEEEIFLKGNFRLRNLVMDSAFLLVTRPDQPVISTVGTLCNLDIAGNLVVDDDFLIVDKYNNNVRINHLGIPDPAYQLYVNSNIFTHTMFAQDTVYTSNLEVSGDLKILGRVDTIDTNVILTERFAISNDGTGPALEVTQLGNADIAHFIDDIQTALIIKDGGNIGVNTEFPTEKLTIDGNVLIHSNLTTKKSTYLQSNLIVTDGVILQSNLSVYANTYMEGSLSVNDIVHFNNTLTVKDTTYLQSNLIVHNEVILQSNLSVYANTYMEGSLSVNDIVHFNNTLTVKDTTYLQSNLMVSDGVILQSNLSVYANTYMEGSLSVNDIVHFNNTLTVKATTYLQSNLIVTDGVILQSNLSVNDNIYVNSNLYVDGTLSLKNNINVDNNAYIQNELSTQLIYTSNIIVEGDVLKVPNGLGMRRPLPTNAPTGSVYYNNDTIRFEGLHDLGGGVKEWLPFGGVVDIDRDTFITAENEPNDNTLTFFTGSIIDPSAIFTSDVLSIHTNVVIDKKIEIKQSATFSNDVLVIGTLSVGNLITDTLTNISEASDVLCKGILSVNQKSYLRKDVYMYEDAYVENTLYTSNLQSSNLNVEGSILKIPTGANADRPTTNNAPTGSIYYNNDTIRFEGLHDLGGGVKEWLSFGGVIDIDGDTFISAEVTPNNNTLSFFTGDKDTPVTTLTSSLLSVGTDVYMDNTLSVNNHIYTQVLHASNIETYNINILSELVFNGNYVVQGNLEVVGNLTINDTTFPLFPNTDDVSKVLAVNDTNDYQLMTLFHENRTCEFKSLFGVFETGTELEEISGLFDFGVPKYWLSGWSGRLFDGVDYMDGQGVLVPDGSNVDMDTIELYENVSTSNMDFKDFINISMYKTNGERLNKISGIAVNDFVNPNYYFFLGTVDPNHDFFKYKFKNDFETFYSDLPNKTYGSNYGYRVDVDSIRVPHRSLHSPGTNMFVVEFINTYDNCALTYDTTNKFNRSVDEETRRTKYHLITSSDTEDIQLIEGNGLFPHITYRKWRNSSKPIFYEKKYHEDIGWGQTPNINDIYTRHHGNGNLKQLYKLTYNFIKNGSSKIDTALSDADLDTLYENNVVTINGHNLMLNSNINQNDNYIPGNYNSISFDKLAFI